MPAAGRHHLRVNAATRQQLGLGFRIQHRVVMTVQLGDDADLEPRRITSGRLRHYPYCVRWFI